MTGGALMRDNTDNFSATIITDKDYLNRISMHYDEFSMTEKKISDYLKNRCGHGLNLSITQFANQAEVSVSSVVRYCKLLGYSGFSELKFHVQQEDFRLAVSDLAIHYGDDMETVKKKTAQYAGMNIDKTMQLVNGDEMDRAIAAVRKAKNVYFYGVGSASGVAHMAANQFMVMGVRAFAQSDMLLNLRNASYLGKDEVMVAINYDGYAKGSTDAIMLAKEAGATTILISCTTDSLSSQYADIVLQTAARNNANVLNIVTLTMCQLAVIQTLMIGVWLQDEAQYKPKSEKQKRIAEMARYDKQMKAVTKNRVKTEPAKG